MVPAERICKEICRATGTQYSAKNSIAELCQREGIAQSMYYVWSEEFLEAGKRRLTGGTSRAMTADDVKEPRREAVARHGRYVTSKWPRS